jgi:hypothetical protein
MKPIALLVWFAVSTPAATIPAGETTAVLHSGDSLAFEILTSNFGYNAARFGLPRNPTDVSFTFITAPVDSQVPFSAWLQSPDGTTAVPFSGLLYFSSAWFAGSQYIGFVSTISGYLHLSQADSAGIFGSGSATLLLVDDGPEITLGLPPNSLYRDLTVTLTGGPLGVGAMSQAVRFQVAVPEPGCFLLLTLTYLSAIFAWASVRRRQLAHAAIAIFLPYLRITSGL